MTTETVNIEGVNLPKFLFYLDNKQSGSVAPTARFNPVGAVSGGNAWQSSTVTPSGKPKQKTIILDRNSFVKPIDFGTALAIVKKLQIAGFEICLCFDPKGSKEDKFCKIVDLGKDNHIADSSQIETLYSALGNLGEFDKDSDYEKIADKFKIPKDKAVVVSLSQFSSILSAYEENPYHKQGELCIGGNHFSLEYRGVEKDELDNLMIEREYNYLYTEDLSASLQEDCIERKKFFLNSEHYKEFCKQIIDQDFEKINTNIIVIKKIENEPPRFMHKALPGNKPITQRRLDVSKYIENLENVASLLKRNHKASILSEENLESLYQHLEYLVGRIKVTSSGELNQFQSNAQTFLQNFTDLNKAASDLKEFSNIPQIKRYIDELETVIKGFIFKQNTNTDLFFSFIVTDAFKVDDATTRVVRDFIENSANNGLDLFFARTDEVINDLFKKIKKELQKEHFLPTQIQIEESEPSFNIEESEPSFNILKFLSRHRPEMAKDFLMEKSSVFQNITLKLQSTPPRHLEFLHNLCESVKNLSEDREVRLFIESISKDFITEISKYIADETDFIVDDKVKDGLRPTLDALAGISQFYDIGSLKDTALKRISDEIEKAKDNAVYLNAIYKSCRYFIDNALSEDEILKLGELIISSFPDGSTFSGKAYNDFTNFIKSRNVLRAIAEAKNIPILGELYDYRSHAKVRRKEEEIQKVVEYLTKHKELALFQDLQDVADLESRSICTEDDFKLKQPTSLYVLDVTNEEQLARLLAHLDNIDASKIVTAKIVRVDDSIFEKLITNLQAKLPNLKFIKLPRDVGEECKEYLAGSGIKGGVTVEYSSFSSKATSDNIDAILEQVKFKLQNLRSRDKGSESRGIVVGYGGITSDEGQGQLLGEKRGEDVAAQGPESQDLATKGSGLGSGEGSGKGFVPDEADIFISNNEIDADELSSDKSSATFDMVKSGKILNLHGRGAEWGKLKIRRYVVERNFEENLQSSEYNPTDSELKKITDSEYNNLPDEEIELLRSDTKPGFRYSLFEKDVTTDAKSRLLSVSPSEKIIGVRANNDAVLEIFRGDDDFYYVKSNKPCKITYVLQDKPPTKEAVNLKEKKLDDSISDQIEERVKTILGEYLQKEALQNQETIEIKKPSDFESHTEYLQYLYEEGGGACMHRVAAVEYKLKTDLGDAVQCRAVDINGNHIILEIQNTDGEWVGFDFGGISLTLKYDDCSAGRESTDRNFGEPNDTSRGLEGAEEFSDTSRDLEAVTEEDSKDELNPFGGQEFQGWTVKAEAEKLAAILRQNSELTEIDDIEEFNSYLESGFPRSPELPALPESSKTPKKIFVVDRDVESLANYLLRKARIEEREVYYIDSPEKIDIFKRSLAISAASNRPSVSSGPAVSSRSGVLEGSDIFDVSAVSDTSDVSDDLIISDDSVGFGASNASQNQQVRLVENGLLQKFLQDAEGFRGSEGLAKKPVLLINWSAFDAKEKLVLNSIFDEERSIKGMPIHDSIQIVGFSKDKVADSSFLSRHDLRIDSKIYFSRESFPEKAVARSSQSEFSVGAGFTSAVSDSEIPRTSARSDLSGESSARSDLSGESSARSDLSGESSARSDSGREASEGEITDRLTSQSEISEYAVKEIDLQGFPDWRAALFGAITQLESRIIWKKGDFVKELEARIPKIQAAALRRESPREELLRRIPRVNIPKDALKFKLTNISKKAQADFQYELEQAKARGYFIYHGYKIAASESLEVDFEQRAFNFEKFKKEDIHVKRSITFDQLPESITLINGYIFDKLLHKKEILAGKYKESEGLIAQKKGGNLKLFISEDLSNEQWYCLLNQAQEYEVELQLYLAPQVELPQLVKSSTLEEDSAIDASVTGLGGGAAEDSRHNSQQKYATILVSNDIEKSLKLIRESSQTGSETGSESETPKSYAIIDIEDYTYQDLVDRITYESSQDLGFYDFVKIESDVLQKLREGKKIILRGEFSNDLLQMLQPILVGEAEGFEEIADNITIIIEDNEISKSSTRTSSDYEKLKWLSRDKYKVQYYPKALTTQILRHEETADISQNISENSQQESEEFIESRKEVFREIIGGTNLLQMLGESGVGKSRLMKMLAEDEESEFSIYREMDSFEEWAKDEESEGERESESEESARTSETRQRNKQKILFLDESNINDSHFTMFAPLKSGGNRRILYKGKFYDLSENHKVVFASNPVEYGGGRFEQKLFADGKVPIMHLEDFPISYIYEKILKDSIYDQIQDSSKISEEEFKKLCQKIIQDYREANASTDKSKHLTVRELQEQVLVEISDDLDRKERGEKGEELEISSESFTTTSANIEAVTALRSAICVRKKQREKKFPSDSVGTNGVILEGDSGVGKSELIKAVLKASGIKDGKYKEESEAVSEVTSETASEEASELANSEQQFFYKIDASLPLEHKKRILIQAFNEGNIAWIDEVNGCIDDGLEKVLNALLTGVHPDNHAKPKNPGFMLITSVNQISMDGRSLISPALKHRCSQPKVKSLQEYEVEDIAKIISNWYLPQLPKDNNGTASGFTAEGENQNSMAEEIARNIAEAFIILLKQKANKNINLRDLKRSLLTSNIINDYLQKLKGRSSAAEDPASPPVAPVPAPAPAKVPAPVAPAPAPAKVPAPVAPAPVAPAPVAPAPVAPAPVAPAPAPAPAKVPAPVAPVPAPAPAPVAPAPVAPAPAPAKVPAPVAPAPAPAPVPEVPGASISQATLSQDEKKYFDILNQKGSLSDEDEGLSEERKAMLEEKFNAAKQEINNNISKEEFYRPEKYSGIGAEVDFEYFEEEKHWEITIKSVVAGGPAARMGLKANKKFQVDFPPEKLDEFVKDIRSNGLVSLLPEGEKNDQTSVFQNSTNGYELFKFSEEKQQTMMAL